MTKREKDLKAWLRAAVSDNRRLRKAEKAWSDTQDELVEESAELGTKVVSLEIALDKRAEAEIEMLGRIQRQQRLIDQIAGGEVDNTPSSHREMLKSQAFELKRLRDELIMAREGTSNRAEGACEAKYDKTYQSDIG